MALPRGAGELNQRITFQKQTVNVDEIGNRINRWSDYYSCWAYVSTSRLSTAETAEAAQTQEQEKLDFIVRCCPETAAIRSTESRIIFREREYDIDRIENAEFRQQWLKFSAHLVRR